MCAYVTDMIPTQEHSPRTQPDCNFFLVNLQSDTSGNFDNLNIQRNNERICHLLARGTENVEIPTTCGTVVELMPGDEIFVECVSEALYITPGDLNNFAGFLINPYLQ